MVLSLVVAPSGLRRVFTSVVEFSTSLTVASAADFFAASSSAAIIASPLPLISTPSFVRMVRTAARVSTSSACMSRKQVDQGISDSSCEGVRSCSCSMGTTFGSLVFVVLPFARSGGGRAVCIDGSGSPAGELLVEIELPCQGTGLGTGTEPSRIARACTARRAWYSARPACASFAASI